MKKDPNRLALFIWRFMNKIAMLKKSVIAYIYFTYKVVTY